MHPPPAPGFHFYTGNPPVRLTRQSPLWTIPIPLNRQDGRQSAQPTDGQSTGVTYGHYFTAAANYLRSNGLAEMTTAANHLLKRTLRNEDIDRIEIHLTKHGAFYHPARVTVTIGADRFRLVLNTAIGDEGRKILPDEFENLRRLNRRPPQNRLPAVYGWGTACSEGAPVAPLMFLGQWLDGFCEFHIARDKNGRQQWQIWNEPGGFGLLAQDQVEDLYRQAAFILASYYNPLTFEAILDWHNAAGDFVIRPTNAGIAVKLITVRRYAPFVQKDMNQVPSVEELLEVLALFFLRTSIWLRLDRLDGIGELEWADRFVLMPICHGLNQGLAHSAGQLGMPVDIVEPAQAFLMAHSNDELVRLAITMLEKWKAGEAEKNFIMPRLVGHIADLRNIR